MWIKITQGYANLDKIDIAYVGVDGDSFRIYLTADAATADRYPVDAVWSTREEAEQALALIMTENGLVTIADNI